MKRINLFLIGVLFMSINLNGHEYNYEVKSDFNLTLWNHAAFRVVFDQHTFNTTSQFGLQNIKHGNHQLQVLQLIPNKHGHGFLKKVLYKGVIKIPKNATVQAVVTPHRKLNIKVVKNDHHHYSQEHQQGCGFQNGYSCSCNNDNWNESYGFDDPFVNNEPCIMSEHDFNQLYDLIDRSSFDDTKLTIAKQAIAMNFFNTHQIASLMSLFSFDSKKVQLAKVAYPKVVDQHNYYKVSQHFTFNSTIHELTNYIQQYG